MTPSAPPPRAVALIALAACQRVVELSISRRNVRRSRQLARAAGGDAREAGTRADWFAMIAIHVALLGLPLAEAAVFGARACTAIFWCAFGAYAAAQALRYWSIASLGSCWNARALIDTRQACVTRGPYRFVRHPNYLAVLIEFSAIPLAVGAWRSWIVLNLVHAPILARRIRSEERLLDAIPAYTEGMSAKGRFLPRVRSPGARGAKERHECS